MNSTKLRIVQDIVNLNEDKIDGIYLHIDKNNLFKCHALIIGPTNTPYFGGNYIFEIIFPKDYPNNPPKVKLLTINNIVRINPNLYADGKVCLSILGTWNGPKWTKVMNLRTVLLSIQSLLSEFPILNEPGYENTLPTDIKSINYNYYIVYHNYNLAIIDILKSLEDKKKCLIPTVHLFKEEIECEFKKNFKNIYDNLKSYMITIGEVDVTTDKEYIYFIKKEGSNIVDFIDLKNKFDNLSLIKNEYLNKLIE